MFSLTATEWTWIIAVGAVYIGLTFACILDAFRRFEGDMDRMIWTQICIIPFLGALAYLLFGRKRGDVKK